MGGNVHVGNKFNDECSHVIALTLHHLVSAVSLVEDWVERMIEIAQVEVSHLRNMTQCNRYYCKWKTSNYCERWCFDKHGDTKWYSLHYSMVSHITETHCKTLCHLPYQIS